MDLIATFLRTALAIFLVMGAWFLWMAYVRRKSGLRCDRDVLEYMTHGCASCQGQGRCHSRKLEKEHHELT